MAVMFPKNKFEPSTNNFLLNCHYKEKKPILLIRLYVFIYLSNSAKDNEKTKPKLMLLGTNHKAALGPFWQTIQSCISSLRTGLKLIWETAPVVWQIRSSLTRNVFVKLGIRGHPWNTSARHFHIQWVLLSKYSTCPTLMAGSNDSIFSKEHSLSQWSPTATDTLLFRNQQITY